MPLMICQKQDKKYCLYRHTTPSGKVYIGITSQKPKYRWNNGKGYFNSVKTPFKSSIKKYGWDNIKHEVLFTKLSESRAKTLEVELIRHYKSLGISLNITDGGEGTVGVIPWNLNKKLSYEQSNKLKGKKLSVEHRKKLSESHLGKSSPLKGRKLSESQIELLRRVNTGRVKSKEERDKIRKAPSKPVIIENNDIILEFSSGTETAKYLNCDVSGVLKCCNGKQKTCKGFKMKFKG